MHTYQAEVFRWAALQGGLSGLAIFGFGIAYAFFGRKLFSGLLPLACAAIGWLAGSIVAAATAAANTDPSPAPSAMLMALLALIAIYWKKFGTSLAGGIVGAACGAYFGNLFEAPREVTLALFVAGAILSTVGSLLCPRTMPLLLTTLLGTALLLIGFVATSTAFVPALGGTFRDMATGQAFVIPIIALMVFVGGYSFQSMQARGDMVTGL